MTNNIRIRNIEELSNEWLKDSVVDWTEPSVEMGRIPALHSKYLKILSTERLIIKKLEADYQKEKKYRWEYYRYGVKDAEEAEEAKSKNLEPLDKSVMRQDIPMYLESDPTLNDIKLRISLHEEMAEFCQSIIQELRNRTFQINGIIKWEIFKSGAG